MQNKIKKNIFKVIFILGLNQGKRASHWAVGGDDDDIRQDGNRRGFALQH